MARRFNFKPDLSEICKEILNRHLQEANGKGLRVFVPQLRDHVMELPGLHFHFNPDLIIGLKGASRLEFIHEHIQIEPNTLALIPGGIPHRETTPPRTRNPSFENLVISVYNQTISVQLQIHRQNKLRTFTEYYDTAKHHLLAQYLEEIAELSHSHPYPDLGIKGLILVYLSTLESAIRRMSHSQPVEKLKISQVKRLVHENLGNCLLSVKFLAGSLHCSSDYLSNLYHIETRERLVTYINKERIKASMVMLRTTSLTIAEVAYAVGFESQGYFSRVFKQIVLKNPAAYRRSVERAMVELEGRPRTIYAAAE